MRLDIRVPIGGMFTILGAILAIFGLVTAGDTEMYARSVGMNVNLDWGVILLIFGILMLIPGLRANKKVE
jgi:multisubunit Na+/H+ antiporter MnhG subunit